MRKMKFGAALLASALCLSAGEASAVTFTVWGSGKSSTGAFLPGGAIDQNYMITSYPGGGSALHAVVVDAGGLPPGTVAEFNSLSPDLQGGGLYTYSTTFSLAGLNPATASISGIWGGDDYPGSALLNGHSISGPISEPSCCFFDGPFSATSGFLPGLNTLSFTIYQADNFFDYARIGDATVTASRLSTTAPEPASLVLLAGALTAARGLRRRTRAS